MKDKIYKFKDHFLIIYCIYFITLFIDTTALVVDYSWIVKPLYVVRDITYILFFIRFLLVIPDYIKDLDLKNFKSKSKKEKFIFFLVIVTGICIIINCIKTHYMNLMYLCLVLLSAYKVDYKKIIKSTFIMQFVLTLAIIVLCLAGVTQNYTHGQRQALGFGYSSNLAQMILFIVLLYMYSKNFKLKYWELIVAQGLNVANFLLTYSRTEAIFLEAIIIFALLYKLNIISRLKKFFKWCGNVFVHGFFLFPIVSFALVLLYPNGGIFDKINSLLSNRLRYPYNDLVEYGISLFGEDITYIGWGLRESILYPGMGSNFIDNEYIQILFSNGIIIAIMFVVLLNILIFMLYKEHKYNELFVCIIYLLFGLINPRIRTLLYCPILFFVIPTFIDYFKGKRIEEKEKVSTVNGKNEKEAEEDIGKSTIS